jgi:hypothetical protein
MDAVVIDLLIESIVVTQNKLSKFEEARRKM